MSLLDSFNWTSTPQIVHQDVLQWYTTARMAIDIAIEIENEAFLDQENASMVDVVRGASNLRRVISLMNLRWFLRKWSASDIAIELEHSVSDTPRWTGELAAITGCYYTTAHNAAVGTADQILSSIWESIPYELLEQRKPDIRAFCSGWIVFMRSHEVRSDPFERDSLVRMMQEELFALSARKLEFEINFGGDYPGVQWSPVGADIINQVGESPLEEPTAEDVPELSYESRWNWLSRAWQRFLISDRKRSQNAFGDEPNFASLQTTLRRDFVAVEEFAAGWGHPMNDLRKFTEQHSVDFHDEMVANATTELNKLHGEILRRDRTLIIAERRPEIPEENKIKVYQVTTDRETGEVVKTMDIPVLTLPDGSQYWETEVTISPDRIEPQEVSQMPLKSDGPQPPNEFWFKGKKATITPKPWQLLKVVWNALDRTILEEDAIDSAWGSPEGTTTGAVNAAKTKISTAFSEVDFPKGISRKNGFLSIS